MKRKRKLQKPTILSFLLTYGLHIWLLLLLANVIVLAAVQFSTHASNCLNQQQVNQDNRCLYIYNGQVYEEGTRSQPYLGVTCGSDLSKTLAKSQIANLAHILSSAPVANFCSSSTLAVQSNTQPSLPVSPGRSPDISVSPVQSTTVTPTPTPAGPQLDLAFTMPGIGSDGGNIKPLHRTRTVTVMLYAPNVNVFNQTVKPLYTMTTQAMYDTDPDSGTFTSFVNHHIDLGADVKDGDYQIVFKTDQALAKLITKKPGDVAGIIYSFNRYNPVAPPLQTMIVGDIAPPPHGNNIMDIHDYNSLMACFGEKANTPSCPDKQLADLNDDGVVDGVDYNIMLASFKILLSLGFPVPTLTPVTPTPTMSSVGKKLAKLTITPKLTVTKRPVTSTPTKKQASSGAGLLFVLLFLILLAAGIFFAIKRKIIPPGLVQKLLQVLQKLPLPKQLQSLLPAQSLPQTKPDKTNGQTQTAPPTEQSQTTTAAPAATTETIPSPAPTTVENEYFVKKKSIDEKGGIWVNLTDDTGQHQGYYKGAEADIKDGFATVKGTMVTEGTNRYILISELHYEE